MAGKLEIRLTTCKKKHATKKKTNNKIVQNAKRHVKWLESVGRNGGTDNQTDSFANNYHEEMWWDADVNEEEKNLTEMKEKFNVVVKHWQHSKTLIAMLNIVS